MPEGDVLAIHICAGGGGGQESQQKQRHVQWRDSGSVEDARGGFGRCGVTRDFGEDSWGVLVCDYFIHDSGAVWCRDERNRGAGSSGEMHCSVAVAKRDFEQAEASEYCERNTFGRVTISAK